MGRSYHASAPCSRNTAAALSAIGAVSTASPHFTQSTAGIGTPQARCREMHQSGRLASISVRRSSPHAGIQRTCFTASTAFSRRPVAVHRHEPLRRGEEDDRVVAAPAVRVRMLERLAVPEAAAIVQGLLDSRVRVEHALPGEQLHVLEEVPAGPDRGVDVEAVLHPRREVVGAVSRRRVHGARALFERHVGGQHTHRVSRVERVTKAQALQIAAGEGRQRGAERALHLRRDALGQPGRHDHRRPADVVGPVLELRVEGDRQVRRDRPRRGRPDENRELLAAGERRAPAARTRARPPA